MMTSIEAMGWLLPITAALCLLVGLGIVGLSMRHMIVKITAATTVSLLIALVFMTVPKWTTLTIEALGVKAQVAKLEKENSRLVAEADAYAVQIDKMQQLAQAKVGTAEELVTDIANAKKDVSWATFLPGESADYAVVVNASTDSAVSNAAIKLGVGTEALLDALAVDGLHLMTSAKNVDLSKYPAQDVLISPFGEGKN